MSDTSELEPQDGRKANRLARETSPYLLQHKFNPVDWFPWGDEALQKARSENKPIFLSVGYSSCHWCHVMEHESFEDEQTARLMNELFVNVKVDREERPDVDEIYMQAVQLFSGGHGGWPMSVFLTPELEPFYAGTYFPPAPRHGMPSFRTVLQSVADAWQNRREHVSQTTQQVVSALQMMARVVADDDVPGTDMFDAAFGLLQSNYDPREGGFGGAPKFPHSMDIGFLLRYAQRKGNADAKDMALRTLRKMARGGMYDQLGGGFHRYSTDARWLVPHFEKMLYDNALLARAYLEGFQVSGDVFLRDVVEHVLHYVRREMTSPEGAFFSAQDADTEGEEGRYFVWTAREILDVCGETEGRVINAYYAVTEHGNFEHGTTVLSVPRDDDVVASELGMSLDALRDVLARGRKRLLEVREQRVRPGLDDKIIAAWNGMMIRAFAQAYQVLRRPEYLDAARAAGTFVLERSADGVFRTWKDGRASGPGFLDDWASMIAAYLDLYEATFEPRWIEAALQWNATVLQEFGDGDSGGFFYTGRRHQELLARSRNFLDTATPSGSSMHIGNLLRLSMLTGDGALWDRAASALRGLGKAIRQYPTAMGEMLCNLHLFHGPAAEVAVAGRGAQADALVHEAFGAFRPNTVVAGWPAEGAPAELGLLRDRSPVEDRPAAYVCQRHACGAPVTTPEALRAALDAALRP